MCSRTLYGAKYFSTKKKVLESSKNFANVGTQIFRKLRYCLVLLLEIYLANCTSSTALQSVSVNLIWCVATINYWSFSHYSTWCKFMNSWNNTIKQIFCPNSKNCRCLVIGMINHYIIPPHLCACPKNQDLASYVTVCFCVPWVKMKGDCWYWWNYRPSLFQLCFHNL